MLTISHLVRISFLFVIAEKGSIRPSYWKTQSWIKKPGFFYPTLAVYKLTLLPCSDRKAGGCDSCRWPGQQLVWAATQLVRSKPVSGEAIKVLDGQLIPSSCHNQSLGRGGVGGGEPQVDATQLWLARNRFQGS